MTAEELNQKLAQHESVLILDVREPYEYQAGHIKGAKLIPLGELRNRVNELPKAKPVICVCHTGSRSQSATRFLRASGLEAVNLTHGMTAWERSGLPVMTGRA